MSGKILFRIIDPFCMGQSPDNLRIEGNENRNAFSLPNRKLVREFEQEISPVTRPKSVTVVPTEKVRSTSSDEKSADEINGSKENISLMNKIRTSRQYQLSKNNSTDRINHFAENHPYPPNLDRRNNSKSDTFPPMSKRNFFENNSFVHMGDRTSGLPCKSGTRFCEPQTETQHVQSGLPRGVRGNNGQGSVDHAREFFRDRLNYMDFPRTFDNSRDYGRQQFSPRSENNNFSKEGDFAKIKPPFNGSYEEWPYFKRLFVEASSLNGWGRQQKLYNLLNSLQGDARTFIISMEGQLSHLSFEDLLQQLIHLEQFFHNSL